MTTMPPVPFTSAEPITCTEAQYAALERFIQQRELTEPTPIHNDFLCGMLMFCWHGIYFGVETDGYVHT